jgi:hypothetical protein
VCVCLCVCVYVCVFVCVCVCVCVFPETYLSATVGDKATTSTLHEV